jgi:hypothetical protein
VAAGQDDEPIRRLAAAVRRLAVETAGRRLTGRSHDDADDVLGTVDSDDAVGFDPLPLLHALAEHGAAVVVMGQVAGIMHGSAELTGDLDLLWDGAPAQAAALAAGFGTAGAELTDGDGVPLRCTPAAVAGPKVLFRTPSASGDCCTPALPWGDLPIADFLARAQLARTADGHPIRYLDRADLIWMRRAVARPKDLRRAAELDHLPGAAARSRPL